MDYFETIKRSARPGAQKYLDVLGPLVVAAETTHMAMVFTDAETVGNPLVFVNDSFVTLTGFSRDEIVGQDLLTLLSDLADSATLSAMKAALASGVDGAWELQCRRADSSEFLAAVYLSPVRDRLGSIRQHILSFVELGGHIERMLKQRNEFHALYEHAPGFIAASEGRDHVFTFANASYKRLVGREDLVGKSVAEALPEIVEQGFIDRLDKVFETGEPFLGTSLPIQIVQPDGTVGAHRYINFVYQPVRDANNRITGLFCEGYDVTLEREAADDLAAVQAELIHLSRVNAMGAMATTLAHELNQPLAAISSFIAGCRRLVDPDSANVGELQQALLATEEASQRAGDIIRHLRELTRRGAPTKLRFDLKAAIAECVRLVTAGRDCDINIVDIGPEDLAVYADRVQIQQVVINLLRNACEAVHADDPHPVTISAAINGDRLVVNVTDTGPGVPTDVAQRIFSWTNTTKAAGMGLGLSISRTIIEAHEGQIWLEQTDETGSTFCFSLPVDPVTSTAVADG